MQKKWPQQHRDVRGPIGAAYLALLQVDWVWPAPLVLQDDQGHTLKLTQFSPRALQQKFMVRYNEKMLQKSAREAAEKVAEASAKKSARKSARVVYLSPQGQQLNHQLVVNTAAQGSDLILIAGRYEGIDERLIESLVDEEWSVGDYVLSGGEFAALVVVDAISRLIPGVLGDDESAIQDSFMQGLLDCPHYTRPETVDAQEVPAVLLSGDHAAIRRWRLKQSLGRTWLRRPDLLDAAKKDERHWDAEKADLLAEFKAEHKADKI